MAYPRYEGFLSDRGQDVRDPSAVEQASVHLRGKVPLVRVSLQGRRDLLNLTHQDVQRTVERAGLKITGGPSIE